MQRGFAFRNGAVLTSVISRNRPGTVGHRGESVREARLQAPRRRSSRPSENSRCHDLGLGSEADLCHCGGISELMRIAAPAEVYNVQMAPHNPYGPVAMAANMYACAAMPDFLILEYCRLRPWYEQVQVFGPHLEGGCVHLNDRPGLGVELDWEYVTRNPFHPIPMRLLFDRDGGLILK